MVQISVYEIFTKEYVRSLHGGSLCNKRKMSTPWTPTETPLRRTDIRVTVFRKEP